MEPMHSVVWIMREEQDCLLNMKIATFQNYSIAKNSSVLLQNLEDAIYHTNSANVAEAEIQMPNGL